MSLAVLSPSRAQNPGLTQQKPVVNRGLALISHVAVEKFVSERQKMTENFRRDEKGRVVPQTPTLRIRSHTQTARYLTMHCARLHDLVIGTIIQDTQVNVVVEIDA